SLYYLSFFFFQAEDGIRDRNVTGVQTCALPISGRQKTYPTMWNHAPKLQKCLSTSRTTAQSGTEPPMTQQHSSQPWTRSQRQAAHCSSPPAATTTCSAR